MLVRRESNSEVKQTYERNTDAIFFSMFIVICSYSGELIREKIYVRKMAKNNSEEINFQNYIDGVKQKEISWKFFVDFIQDLSYSDNTRLRILNAMLLKELTIN